MKKIIVATDIPFWLRRKGNQQRIAELVDYLAAHYRVTIAWLGADRPSLDDERLEVKHLNRHRGLAALAWKLYGALPPALQQWVVRLLARLRIQRSVNSFDNPVLADRFAELCATGDFDAVVIEYIWHASLVSGIDRQHTRLLLDTHDIYHQRIDDYARFGLQPDKSVTKEQELAIFARFDDLIAIQRQEYDYLDAQFPGRAVLAMHPVRARSDLAGQRAALQPEHETLTIVYFASFGDANIDGINWFVDAVWNAELSRYFSLHIYGAICPSLRFSANGVEIRGQTPTVEAVYADADIALNPQRFGSGLKIKTIEAMSYGLPVLTTSAGAAGIESQLDRGLLCADDTETMRVQLLRLRDPALRRSMAAHNLDFVSTELTPDACFGALRERIETSGTRTGAS